MIGVLGLGFVGLTTALGLAEKTGLPVYGWDPNREKTGAIGRGEVPFHEPGLGEALGRQLGKGFLLASSGEEVARRCQVLFFCVGTPQDRTGKADLSMLAGAVADCLPHLEGFTTLVIKSTVPPTTAATVLRPLVEAAGLQVGEKVGLCSNPEFLREGSSWRDFMEPDRIVIGADDPKSLEALLPLYRPFAAPIEAVSLNTAEFAKYLSNTLLATMISFSNELAMTAHALGGIEIKRAFEILHRDRRWKSQWDTPAPMATYAFPGCGFGGYCLPKDTLALARQAAEAGVEPLMLEGALETNRRVMAHTADRIAAAAGDPATPIGVLGLSFKPGSDDIRQTPAAAILAALQAKGYRNLLVWDPLVKAADFEAAYGLGLRCAGSLEEVRDFAQVVAILTGSPEYLPAAHWGKPVVDGRYLL